MLLARLRALLRRGRRGAAGRPRGRRPARSTPPRTGSSRGDVEVELTPRQFSLLEFLLRRAGEVLSEGEILDHVWDFAFDGDPNIVEVYVGQLRRRIDEPFGRAGLQTVRGVGYRLDPDGG